MLFITQSSKKQQYNQAILFYHQTMASSSYALRTIPTSFVKPTAFGTTPKSFLTPSSAFTPFISSTSSLTKNLRMNAAFSQSCFSSVAKNSFTCKSQANEYADTGNNHIHTKYVFFKSFLVFLLINFFVSLI